MSGNDIDTGRNNVIEQRRAKRLTMFGMGYRIDLVMCGRLFGARPLEVGGGNIL